MQSLMLVNTFILILYFDTSPIVPADGKIVDCFLQPAGGQSMFLRLCITCKIKNNTNIAGSVPGFCGLDAPMCILEKTGQRKHAFI